MPLEEEDGGMEGFAGGGGGDGVRIGDEMKSSKSSKLVCDTD